MIWVMYSNDDHLTDIEIRAEIYIYTQPSDVLYIVAGAQQMCIERLAFVNLFAMVDVE